MYSINSVMLGLGCSSDSISATSPGCLNQERATRYKIQSHLSRISLWEPSEQVSKPVDRGRHEAKRRLKGSSSVGRVGVTSARNEALGSSKVGR